MGTAMERALQEEYEAECWPETEPPAFISDLFLECRARALHLHEVRVRTQSRKRV